MTKARPSIEFSDSQIAKMSYEEARANLQEVVGQLEAGGSALEESLGLFELSEKLADRCEEILDSVADKIEEDDGDDDYEDDDDSDSDDDDSDDEEDE